MPDLKVRAAYDVKSASPVNHPDLYARVAEDGSGVSHAEPTESTWLTKELVPLVHREGGLEVLQIE